MPLMSKLYSLPIVLLLIFSIFSIQIDGVEFFDSSMDPSFSRSLTADPETHLFLDGSDEGSFSLLDNISSEDGITFSMEKNGYENLLSIPSSPLSTRDIQGRRTIVTFENVTYFTYMTVDPDNQTFSFFFIAYRELEDIFEDPMLIHTFNGSTEGYISMAAGNDELYFLMSPVRSIGSDSGVYAKVVPVDQWYLAHSFDTSRLDEDGDVSTGIAIVATSTGACAFWRTDPEEASYRSVYSDGAWSDVGNVRSNVGAMSVAVGDINGEENVIFVFTTEGHDHVNVTMSQNGGLSFGINQYAGFTDDGVTSVSAACNAGMVHISAVRSSTNDIFHFMSSNGGPFISSGVIASYSTPGPGQVEMSHMAIERNNVLIVYQDGNGISGTISFDGGSTFNRRYDHSPFMIFSPSIQIDKKYMSYHDGTDLIILRYILEDDALMVSDPITPMGVWSWESIGFDVQGIESGTTISFRIMDRSGGQLFPSSGWGDVLAHGEGQIAGHDMDHLIPMEGAWSDPGTGTDSIYFELMIERNIDDDPVISMIGVDHSTIFPVVESTARGFHVHSIDNMTLTSKGIELNADQPIGSVILGPLRKETIWADVMTVRLHSFSNKILLKGSILDMNMDTIPSYRAEDCDLFNDISGPDQIRWNGKHFGNIPDTIASVYIKFELSKTEPTADPYIGSISFLYSDLPVISQLIPPSGSVNRGGSVDFSLILTDAEDEPEELLLIVQSSLTGSDDWISYDHIMGVLWTGSGWDVTFNPSTDSVVGTYIFRAWITDLSGNVSGPLDLQFNVEVLNVRPEPPLAHIEPEIIRTDSRVFVEIDTIGTDLEMDDPSLDHQWSVFRNDAPYNGEQMVFEPLNLTIPEGIVKKDDVWRIEISSFDGMDKSDPGTLEFTVVNTAPMVEDPPSVIVIDEDIPLIVQPGPLTWFKDIDGDTLDLSFEVPEGVDVELTGETFTITPWEDYYGSALLMVTAYDGVVNTTIHVDLEILPVNDAPLLELPENLTVKQGEWLLINVISSDPADGEVLSISSNVLDVIPGAVLGENVLEYPNGSIFLRTDNRMIGSHEIVLNVSDGTVTVEGRITIVIENVNDPPTRPQIMTVPSELINIGPMAYVLRCNSSDLDIWWGDALTFTWTSSIMGELGTGDEIEVVLSPGIHLITAEVMDLEGLVNSTTIEIVITEDVDNKDDVMRTNILLIILGVTGLLIGILAGALILFLSKRKKDEGGEDTGHLRKDGDSGEEKSADGTPPQKENGGAVEEKVDGTAPGKEDEGVENRGGEKHE